MCDTPLSQQLLSARGGEGQQPGEAGSNGLLTMDQARSVLPLTADDPNVSECEWCVCVCHAAHRGPSIQYGSI